LPTVVELIDQRPLSSFQIRTIILCGLVLVLDGFDSQAAGTIGAAISENMHIPLKTMGYVFSASLFGLMLAAMAAGPIADRWGGKWMVVLSTVTFAIFSLLTARATSYNQLVAFRFLTGLGLGAALPTVVSIASEYSPKRRARTVVAVLFTGMPLGNFLCGLISSVILHRYGWRSVFYVGGVVPLAVATTLRRPPRVHTLFGYPWHGSEKTGGYCGAYRSRSRPRLFLDAIAFGAAGIISEASLHRGARGSNDPLVDSLLYESPAFVFRD
jgi:MFS family permease